MAATVWNGSDDVRVCDIPWADLQLLSSPPTRRVKMLGLMACSLMRHSLSHGTTNFRALPSDRFGRRHSSLLEGVIEPREQRNPVALEFGVCIVGQQPTPQNRINSRNFSTLVQVVP